MSLIFLALGMVCAFVSAVTLVLLALFTNGHLWKAIKVLYVVVAALCLYLGVIYGLAFSGVLEIPAYSDYIRPLMSLLVLAPAFIALSHWRNRR